jgi:hypothetical protein
MTGRASNALPGGDEPLLAPEVALAYRQFLRRTEDASFDPYYSDEIVRFELRDDDVVIGPGDVRVEPADCGATLVSERARARVLACGVSAGDVRSVLAAIDGERTAGEVRRASGVSDDAFRTLVARAFGVLLFAPHAVGNLEARVPCAELVRFPGSPYEIVRAYWENMADVAEAVANAEPSDPEALVRLLRETHVLALVGRSRASFYRPASPIVSKSPLLPGDLLREPPLTEETPDGVRFVSGPRVNAAPIGGEHHHALLLASLEGAPRRARRDVTRRGALAWGQVLLARADADDVARPWFCPPRPLEPSHFEEVARALSESRVAVRGGDTEAAWSALARLHWELVRLHPFGFANQCLAMSLVNDALRRLHGAGIPHLVLDHLALTLPEEAYVEVFARAVQAWLVRGGAVQRTLELVARKRRAFALLGALRGASSLAEAARVVAGTPGDAPLVMLARSGAPSGRGT